MLEVLSTVFGLIQGVLVMLDKRSNWIFYSLQMFFLVLFSINVHLWGDVAIDSIYFFVGIGGYFLWRPGNRAAAISVYGWKVRIVWGLASTALIILSWIVLSKTNNPLPLLDSITSVTSIIATWFMFNHKLEAWVVWFLNDVFYIAEYFMLPDRALYLIGLYIIWTVLAIVSFVNWKRLYRIDRGTAKRHEGELSFWRNINRAETLLK